MASRNVPDGWDPSKRRRELFWRFVKIGAPDECWPWILTLDEKGYGHATVDGWCTTAHRIAYALNTGHVPDGLVVMHQCDNRACCNPNHLDAGTQGENLADMTNKGRRGDTRNFGEQHGRCKVTDAQVEEMRVLRAAGWSQMRLARYFRIGQTQVARILNGQSRQYAAGSYPVDRTIS